MKYTKESLQNTWGVVESKEHAEFIIELCKANNISIYKYSYPIKKDIFSVNKHGMLFFHEDNGLSLRNELKQITIPLPPKNKAEKPDLSKLPKHFDCVCNKCGGRCCVGNCDEWPQVGDVVTTRGGSKGVLIVSKPDNDGMVICNFDGEYALTYLSELQKLKTLEDKPRDKSSDIPQSEKRNKSKQAYEILKSLDYDYDLDKQKWFKKHYI